MLSFRGDLPRRPAVEKELKIVAVRTPLRRPQQRVARPALRPQRRQRSSVRAVKIRRVREPRQLRSRRDLGVGRLQVRRQCAHAFGAQGDQTGARWRELRLERREFSFHDSPRRRRRAVPPVFQQAVALRQRAVIGLQDDQRFWIRRRKREVEPAAAQ